MATHQFFSTNGPEVLGAMLCATLLAVILGPSNRLAILLSCGTLIVAVPHVVYFTYVLCAFLLDYMMGDTWMGITFAVWCFFPIMLYFMVCAVNISFLASRKPLVNNNVERGE